MMDPTVTPARLKAGDLQVGQTLPSLTRGPITRLDFARYSAATDDPNRIHIEEEIGHRAGFESVIGSGGLILAVMEKLVRDWAGIENVRRASGRMSRPLYAFETLVTEGSVLRVFDERDVPLAECEVRLQTSEGHLIAQGTFVVEVAP